MCADIADGDALWPQNELPEHVQPEPKVKRLDRPIWTENKAKLIERYLQYFVFITHHGTYIDGFAGPQELDKPDMWAAKLVLDNEPKWFKHFYLFEKDRNKVKLLQELKQSQSPVDSKGNPVKNREIQIFPGDFNRSLPSLLSSGCIKQKEATFCLLDQRTFECEWSSLKLLADYKTGGNKIELFYFLGTSWLGRALSGQKDMETLQRWWGRDDYQVIYEMKAVDRLQAFRRRFKEELGYMSVKPWPIYANQSGKRIMYHMIHATDHRAAPDLMDRAYRHAVRPKESHDQIAMALGIDSKEPE